MGDGEDRGVLHIICTPRSSGLGQRRRAVRTLSPSRSSRPSNACFSSRVHLLACACTVGTGVRALCVVGGYFEQADKATTQAKAATEVAASVISINNDSSSSSSNHRTQQHEQEQRQTSDSSFDVRHIHSDAGQCPCYVYRPAHGSSHERGLPIHSEPTSFCDRQQQQYPPTCNLSYSQQE